MKEKTMNIERDMRDFENVQGFSIIDSIKQLAYYLYCRYGSEGVYRLANFLEWDRWEICEPCDARTPFIDHECLICGHQSN